MASPSAVDRSSEYISDTTCLLSEDVCIDPECDRGVGVTETSRDHMHRYASEQQRRRV